MRLIEKNKMKDNKISVCIASYNGEKFIKEQINSILSQLEDEDEIIISDNGSTDRTLEVLNEFNDDRIKIFTYKSGFSSKSIDYERKLINIYYNFRNAFQNAKNEIIFLSDQDDIWFDNKYSIIKDAMKSYDFVAHDCLMFRGQFSESMRSLFEMNNISQGSLSYFNIIKDNPFLGCCIAFKREIGIDAFKYDNAIIPHDTWLALIAYMKNKNKFLILNEPLIYYRVHNNNNSYIEKSENSLFFKLKYRLKLALFSLKNYIYAK
ncbi:glycosyltransferase [Elizabethkingia meningoseptica]|nr:glycosyltransferase [Elizabethkingia meningoseptica]MDE5432893.1 glycosyltransferase [Elizabethkingia meningoseptica]MDE5524558.1 glycosyltransferase [Elizabethkingia meningoseptica]